MSGATNYLQQYGRFRCSVMYGAHYDVQPPMQRASRSWTKRCATCTSSPTNTSGAAALTGFCYRSPSHNLALRVYPMPPRAGWPSARGRPQLEDGLARRQGGADHQIRSSQHGPATIDMESNSNKWFELVTSALCSGTRSNSLALLVARVASCGGHGRRWRACAPAGGCI
jgi:hypothetical protein